MTAAIMGLVGVFFDALMAYTKTSTSAGLSTGTCLDPVGSCSRLPAVSEETEELHMSSSQSTPQGGEQYWMTWAEQHFIAFGRGDLIC
jgi:hypothetical protein